MPKNNSKARKQWRKTRIEVKERSPEERLLAAIFGVENRGADDAKPGTEHERG